LADASLRIAAETGISNLADEKYYSRVFFDGSIEPDATPLWLRWCFD
jgi:hypothetical protein